MVFLFSSIGYGGHAETRWEDDYHPISFQVQVLPWKLVNEMIPKGSEFTIIDVESGLQFRVQRRAGRDHADVQPLTAKDTRIMKQIYGNKWSWKRKAILVLYGDHLIAASMNGMPHGAGALQNNFRGHFCVHFYGSLTHLRHKEDLAHKLMILKAAGKKEEYIRVANANEILHIFAVAVNQQDPKLLKSVLDDTGCIECFIQRIQNYSSMKLNMEWDRKKAFTFHIEIPATIELYVKGEGRKKRKVNIILQRKEITGPWQISLYHLEREWS